MTMGEHIKATRPAGSREPVEAAAVAAPAVAAAAPVAAVSAVEAPVEATETIEV